MSGQQLTAPTRSEFKTLKECRNLGEAFQSGEFMERIKASAPSHVKPQRLLRTFVQATSKAPLLLECSMRSVLGAMLTCSEVGLEPNTPLQHAFLIPFGKYKWNKQKRERELVGYEVQLIFGYPGLLDLSYRSGQVTSVHADVAYKDEYDNGRFKFEYGTNAILSHRPERARPEGETPAFGYCHASLTNGQAFHVMPWLDILKIRNGSQGFRSALAAKEAAETKNWKMPATWTEAPWVKHERKMAGKTVFRSLANWLPKSVELAGVLALDDTQDRGTIDFGAVLDGDASITDGGYQESGTLVEDESDSTAAFGLRSVPNDPDPPANDPDPPKAEKPKAATKPKPAPVVTAPEPPPQTKIEEPTPTPTPTIGKTAFAAWLVNGDGEPIGDNPERYTDPVLYATALRRAMDDAFPGDRELMRMANADDADEASRISKEAWEILAPRPPPTVEQEAPPIDEPPPPESTQEQGDPWQIAAPIAPNKAEWDAWNERLKALLETATTPDAFYKIVELNEPTFKDFPPKFRISAKTIVEARQNAMTTKQDPNAPPTFQQIHDALLVEIDACTSEKDLRALEKNTGIVRRLAVLKTGAPALCEAVQVAARHKAETLKAPLI